MAIKCLPTQFTANFVLCGLFLLIIPTCELRSTPKERFTRHMSVVRQFPCRLPQPRAIKAKELLGDQLDTSETITPLETVLHRCDAGTGCCFQENKVCKVAEEEEVELHFHIQDTIRGRSEFKEFIVNNHTKCSCQSITNDIK